MMLRHPLLPVFAIGLISLVGLFAGLTGDGIEDAVAVLALTLCLLPVAWALRRR